MRFRVVALLSASLCFTSFLTAQTPDLSPKVKEFIKVNAPKVILTHVRVIDGTGAPAIDDRNLVIESGKITAIGPGADVPASSGITVLDLRNHSVMPGIVGMHNHLFYIALPNLSADWKHDSPLLVPQMTFSAPRLYLAGGVTTMRTTGSVETYADLNLKHDIDAGQLPGPRLDVTGPYLEGATSYFIQMPRLKNAADARETVDYWADRGVTSFKAYMNITRDELKAAIEAAHKRGLKVTGHLCSVSYPEAIELGIDDLEHGFYVNTQLDPDKKPDACSESEGQYTLEHMTPGSPEAKKLIDLLVSHHVAITSTLPVFEAWGTPDGLQPPIPKAALDAMSPEARSDFLVFRQKPVSMPKPKFDGVQLYKNNIGLEREFAEAGGLLLAGPDPTGGGDVVPGFGDQRELELLVQGGFSPLEAVKISTLNGAIYLGRDHEIGSIAPGKNADLVVMKGDPSKQISDVENVEIVFKDGIGYDSAKLLDSVRGHYGQY
ncbi:MAG TPA: amidohydrolase family protein [Terriglobales bacterium]